MSSRIEQALKSASETRALLIGQNILNRVPELFAEHFPNRKALIVADTATYGVAGKEISEFLRSSGITQESPFVSQSLT